MVTNITPRKAVDWLEVENAKLKEETDAVAAAAQVIGKSLRGRVKELEQEQVMKKSHFSDEQIRDGFFFLAGILTGITVCSVVNMIRKHSIFSVLS
jgi:hypothetical protein